MIALKRTIKRADAIFAAVVFTLLLGVFFMLFIYYFLPPRIVSITPTQVKDGDTIVITGRNFGEVGEEGRVYISNQLILTSHYKLWSDSEIHIDVDKATPSGFLTVVTRRGKSKPQLISNVDVLIEPMSAYARGMSITSVNPTVAYIGERITLRGSHFGDEPYNYDIGFAHPKDGDILIPAEDVVWSDAEISLTIPNGATSGIIRVRTAMGSVETKLSVLQRGGNVVYGDAYEFNLGYDIQLSYIAKPELLYIWTPKPKISAAQPQVEAQLDVGEGTLVVQPRGDGQNYVRQFSVQRYSVHTNIRPQDVQQDYLQDVSRYLKSPLHKDNLVDINRFVQSVIKQEKNPYYKAMYLFQALVENMQPSSGSTAFSDVAVNFARGSGGSFDYASIYAEALRLAGVPARVLTGVLVDNQDAWPHAWVEFLLEGFGWVPADVALADGMHNEIEALFLDRRQYFGNLDAFHVEFEYSLPDYSRAFYPATDPTATFIYNTPPDFAPRPIQGYFYGDGRFLLHYGQPSIDSIINASGKIIFQKST